jgi:hypothetical protein
MHESLLQRDNGPLIVQYISKERAGIAVCIKHDNYINNMAPIRDRLSKGVNVDRSHRGWPATVLHEGGTASPRMK